MWPSRLAATIRREAGHVVIIAPPEYGGHVVVSALSLRNQPVLRVLLPDVKDSSTVLYGNALSDAFDQAFGFRLFGSGVPIEYGLRLMLSQVKLLGRSTVAISTPGQIPPSLAQTLVQVDPSQIRTVLATAEIAAEVDLGTVRVLGAADLALSLDEAVEAVSGEVHVERVERIWKKVDGAYLSFITEINREVSRPPLALVKIPEQLSERAGRSLAPVLLRQGRWLEALQLVSKDDPLEAVRVFKQCAPVLLEQGLQDALWAVVEDFADTRLLAGDDEAMYWYFQVATAANQIKSVYSTVREYLEENEAPDLRARWAVAVPTASSMDHAKRAHRAAPNINTARALAFLYAFEGATSTAVNLLKWSIELAQVEDDKRMICLLALDVSHAHVLGAKYRVAREWGRWGLDRLLRWGVGDELLRVNLVNQVGYLELLTGEVGSAEDRLASLPDSDELLGIPMMEALLSTRADLAYLKDDLATATALYTSYYEDYLPISRTALGAIDVAKCHARSGDGASTESVWKAVSAVHDSSPDRPTKAALRLVNAQACISRGAWLDAARICKEVLLGDASSDGAFLHTQAVLIGASALSLAGQRQEALDLLVANRWTWEELGDSGWALLTPTPAVALDLCVAVGAEPPRAGLKVLGGRSLQRPGGAVELSRRNAELAALLAIRRTGYRGEQLLLDMYGERGREGTLKAQVSRLREFVQITANPYRLDEDLGSDVESIHGLLAKGDLHRALELYRGPLLPESEAPGIVRERERIDEALRQAILLSGEQDLTLRLARKFGDDLELWERAQELTATDDPAYPLVRAQVRRIRGEWGL